MNVRDLAKRVAVRAASLATLALSLAACGRNAAAPVASASPAAAKHATAAPPAAVPIEISGKRSGNEPIRVTERSHGKVSFTIVADALRGHYSGQDTGTSDLTNPHITFVGAGAKRLYAVAPAGTVVEKDKTVLMTGGVHARSQDGMTLASDVLRFDDTTQLVHGSGHVVVTFPRGERLTGQTVDWNLRTGDVEMNTGTP